VVMSCDSGWSCDVTVGGPVMCQWVVLWCDSGWSCHVTVGGPVV